jgi:hypothetical protein
VDISASPSKAKEHQTTTTKSNTRKSQSGATTLQQQQQRNESNAFKSAHSTPAPATAVEATKAASTAKRAGTKRRRETIDSITANITPKTSPQRSVKRAKRDEQDDNSEQPRISVLLTGVKLDKKYLKDIESMGAVEASSVASCTHLVCPKIMRTEKLLLAVTLAKEIVLIEWIHESVKAGRWLGKLAIFFLDRNTL